MKARRLEEIQRYIGEHGVCTYEELCQFCGVSMSTIRRDVDNLAKLGRVAKSHGGILTVEKEAEFLDMEIKPACSLEAGSPKDRIARSASRLVEDNDIIFLGSGMTVAHMLRYLKDKSNITVITNNLVVLNQAVEHHFKVTMIGGVLSRDTMSLIGIQSIKQLSQLNANKAFISCNGIALTHGVTNVSDLEADIKTAAISISAETILLVDQEKFDKISLYTFAKMEDFSTIITDREPKNAYRDLFRNSNARLIIAREGEE